MPAPDRKLFWKSSEWEKEKIKKKKIEQLNWIMTSNRCSVWWWCCACVYMVISLPRMSHEILDHLLAWKFFLSSRLLKTESSSIVQKRRRATFIAVVKNDLTSSLSSRARHENFFCQTYSKHLLTTRKHSPLLSGLKANPKCLKSFA